MEGIGREIEIPLAEKLQNFQLKTPNYKEDLLVEAIKKLKNYVPLPSEEDKEEALKEFIGKWFSERIKKRYSLLSSELLEELFSLKQTIRIDLKLLAQNGFLKDKHDEEVEEKTLPKEQITLDIPLIVKARYQIDKGWEYSTSKEINYHTYKIHLFSKMPIIPEEVKSKAREAMALVHQTYADALSREGLGEILLENPNYVTKPNDARLWVVWKLEPSELQVRVKVINRDPALLLEYNNYYLLATWKEPEGGPFVNLLYSCAENT